VSGARRALVMAGGGLKVAYQAGVLQVWLDEAGVEFDLATASSGGTLNLAMWTQGRSGREIADAWRAYRPLSAATTRWRAPWRGPFSPALLTQEGLRRAVLPAFGLDWHAIRTSSREAAFDVFDFTAQEPRVVEPAQLTEDLLLSASALPLWFPPVRIGGDDYVDGVFATDADLDEAVRRGANELWVVWTVSTAGAWRNGFVHGYFQMIEAMANAGLRASLRRIEESNAAIARGAEGTYPHRVCVKVLTAEVPLHYLVVLRADRFARAVDLGVRDARRWCADRGVPVADAPPPPSPGPDAAGVSFRERMSGRIDVVDGLNRSSSEMALELDVRIPDLDAFRADPDHRTRLFGDVVCPALGGRLPIRRGTFDVLTEQAIGDLRMVYSLDAAAPGGRVLRIHGEKFVRHTPGLQLWRDTTTLHVTVHVGDAEIGAGVLHLTVAGFVAQLAGLRGHGPTTAGAVRAVARFADFFLGRLTLARPSRPRTPLPRWLRRVADR